MWGEVEVPWVPGSAVDEWLQMDKDQYQEVSKRDETVGFAR